MSDYSVNENTKISDESVAKDGTFDGSPKNIEKNIYREDLLAKIIAWVKEYIEMFHYGEKCVKSSEIYIFITKYTQPATIILLCTFILILLTVWPNVYRKTSSTERSNLDQSHPLAGFVFFAAFATHFGVQVWMSFVAGLLLFFTIPRHVFGEVQQILFPRYFTLNIILSIIMILTYGNFLISRWDFGELVQLFTLILVAVIEAILRLYFARPFCSLQLEKYNLEKTADRIEELVFNQHYQNVNKAFRRAHIVIDLANLTITLLTFLQLSYISLKTNFP